ncbi:hypothetical protein F2P81_018016 [Scophthalmus maximus]|uniref:AIG1-type G domain-containing protein n=2 Tax=Scophthalmus maximus TaxID=52904 RepID=A0A6A4SCT7_SCOMX|nr:hypothetical protein F2P81_018016 [Scophthalmus maximus]
MSDLECSEGSYCHATSKGPTHSRCQTCRRRKRRCHRDSMCCPGNRCSNDICVPDDDSFVSQRIPDADGHLNPLLKRKGWKKRERLEVKGTSGKGQVGDPCLRSSDCSDSLCCARHFWTRICKPVLREGQVCTRHRRKGNHGLELFQRCPCADGLSCRTLREPGGAKPSSPASLSSSSSLLAAAAKSKFAPPSPSSRHLSPRTSFLSSTSSSSSSLSPVGKTRLHMDLPPERSHHGNSLVSILSRWNRQRDDNERNVLALNVLLLGDRQSGRSSVGNALIGGHEFQTDACVSGVSVTTECQVLRRNFPGYFRRQGAETDLTLRVIDTPAPPPRPLSVHELCPEGVHVLVLVVRADRSHDNSHLEKYVESLFGPEWRRHAILILTHSDYLEKAGLRPSVYLTQTTDWLEALSSEAAGGVLFLDNSRDWPLIRGRPLRDGVLRLSARNHHRAVKVRTEVSL